MATDILQHIRSVIFDLVFYSLSLIVLLVCCPLIWILPRWFLESVAYLWAKASLYLLHQTVGLKVDFHGFQKVEELTKNGPVIFACQHQSALDVVFPYFILNNFSVVLKKELLYVPLIGLYHLRLGSIFVNRKRGLLSIRHMFKNAQKQISLKRNILIYPEGHRNKPGAKINCQPGVFLLYQKLNCTVIPISLNTGVFWGRRTPFKKPGTINVYIEPAIKPGLTKTEFMNTLNQSFTKKTV